MKPVIKLVAAILLSFGSGRPCLVWYKATVVYSIVVNKNYFELNSC